MQNHKNYVCKRVLWLVLFTNIKTKNMNLQLSLKTKWFEMTKAGIKTEDYREINIYWEKDLCTE